MSYELTHLSPAGHFIARSAFIACCLLLFACSGHDDPPEVITEPGSPRITFAQSSYTLQEGVPAVISGTITSNPALVSIKYFVVNGGTETPLGTSYTTGMEYPFSQTITPTAATTGFKVIALNKAGEETAAEAPIALQVDEERVNNLTVSPKNNARAAFVDTRLAIEFPSAPVLGNSGIIGIYKTDGTKVDEINLADAQPRLENGGLYNTSRIDLLPCGDRVRAVNYRPAFVKGNTLVIQLHSGVLDYKTQYYVTIDAAVVQGITFEGITAHQWTFTTKSAAPTATTVTVDDDGEADFRTIQAAIVYSLSKGKDAPVTIQIKNGVYEELLFVRNKNNLTLKGESRDGVIITYDNYDQWNGGTGGSIALPAAGGTIATAGGRAIFLMESCDMLRLDNLTLTNTHGAGNQAETMYFNSSGRLLVVNCTIGSHQDTLCLKGYCWFYNTLVSGDVDFIWGGAEIALFEQCEIRSVTASGYILQARTPAPTSRGFVFLNCSLSKASGVADNSTSLARSAGNSSYYDNVSFINCRMDTHIAVAGWHNNPLPNPATATATGGWKEYGSKNINGETLSVTGRLQPGSYQLTESEYTAGYSSRTAVFAGYANGTAWMDTN
jgi:pectin methylesterase-like acyl-CoA thioesterase